MLPKKLHVKEINRFHAKVKRLKKRIDNEPDKQKRGELAGEFWRLDKLWQKIDNFIEFEVKNKLDTWKETKNF